MFAQKISLTLTLAITLGIAAQEGLSQTSGTFVPTGSMTAPRKGHTATLLNDGRVFEERQPHIRGGVNDPLSRDDIENKFRGNVAFGGWSAAQPGVTTTREIRARAAAA